VHALVEGFDGEGSHRELEVDFDIVVVVSSGETFRNRVFAQRVHFRLEEFLDDFFLDHLQGLQKLVFKLSFQLEDVFLSGAFQFRLVVVDVQVVNHRFGHALDGRNNRFV
jgi:hypothetical protein